KIAEGVKRRKQSSTSKIDELDIGDNGVRNKAVWGIAVSLHKICEPALYIRLPLPAFHIILIGKTVGRDLFSKSFSIRVPIRLLFASPSVFRRTACATWWRIEIKTRKPGLEGR